MATGVVVGDGVGEGVKGGDVGGEVGEDVAGGDPGGSGREISMTFPSLTLVQTSPEFQIVHMTIRAKSQASQDKSKLMGLL